MQCNLRGRERQREAEGTVRKGRGEGKSWRGRVREGGEGMERARFKLYKICIARSEKTPRLHFIIAMIKLTRCSI